MEKELYLCPNCGKELGKFWRKDEYTKVGCRKCRKWIWLNTATCKYQIKEIPERTDSAGVIFY